MSDHRLFLLRKFSFVILLPLAIALAPVVSRAQFGTTLQIFPHIAYGGGYLTTFTVHNPGQAKITVKFEVYSAEGLPVSGFPVEVEVGPDDSQSITLGQGLPTPSVGWARLSSTNRFAATELFQFTGSQGEVLSEAGVLPSSTTKTFRIFAISGPNKATGIALANPDPDSAAVVSIRSAKGDLALTDVIRLGPLRQLARFLPDISPKLAPFEGVLEFTSTQPISAVTLRQDGQQLAALPVLTDERLPPDGSVDRNKLANKSVVRQIEVEAQCTRSLNDRDCARDSSGNPLPLQDEVTLVPFSIAAFPSATVRRQSAAALFPSVPSIIIDAKLESPTAATITLAGPEVDSDSEGIVGVTREPGSVNVSGSAREIRPTVFKLSLKDNSIITSKLRDGAISAPKLADGSVQAAKLANNAVQTEKLADNAVQTAKLADNAVQGAKLADRSVTTVKISGAGARKGDALVFGEGSNPLWAKAVRAGSGLSLEDSSFGEGPAPVLSIAPRGVVGTMIAQGAVALDKIDTSGASVGQVIGFDFGGARWTTPPVSSGGGLTLPFTGNASSSGPAFNITNQGQGVGADTAKFVNSGTGSAGVFTVTSPTNSGPAVDIQTKGTGAALQLTGDGKGPLLRVNGVRTGPDSHGLFDGNVQIQRELTLEGALKNSRGFTNVGNDLEVKGNLNVIGRLSKASGSFRIDHPLDPTNRYLSHSFVESPDMMNIYNGNIRLDQNGEAWIELPAWFEALNRDFRYQLTALGVPCPNLYISEEVSNNRFKIAGGAAGAKVSWQVTGIRNDAHAKAHRIQVEEEKPESERGKYSTP
jgi:hypothetical protein